MTAHDPAALRRDSIIREKDSARHAALRARQQAASEARVQAYLIKCGVRGQVCVREVPTTPAPRTCAQPRSGVRAAIARGVRFCKGTTCNGNGCKVNTNHTFEHAVAPLRAGGEYCGHHDPSGAMRCAGVCPNGARCAVTRACSYAGAQPLRDGGTYCSNHGWQGWEPPDDCVGADGACAAAMRDFDTSVT